jgi:hypothetical protein
MVGRMRFKAIYSAIKHGCLPWWMYEREKHYKGSYWSHLWLNIKYAWRWIIFREFESDIEFEKQINMNTETIVKDLPYWKQRAEYFEKEFDSANKEIIYLQNHTNATGEQIKNLEWYAWDKKGMIHNKEGVPIEDVFVLRQEVLDLLNIAPNPERSVANTLNSSTDAGNINTSSISKEQEDKPLSEEEWDKDHWKGEAEHWFEEAHRLAKIIEEQNPTVASKEVSGVDWEEKFKVDFKKEIESYSSPVARGYVKLGGEWAFDYIKTNLLSKEENDLGTKQHSPD